MAIDLDNNTLAKLDITSPIYTEGTSRADTITGNASSDYIKGLAGLDIINGGGGNDYIEGGTSPMGGLLPEILNGGDGNDTAGYINATGSVTVNLLLGLATGPDGLDTLLNFENVVGSNYTDTITGNNGNNVFMGMDGDDTINGADGNDKFYGGPGNDKLFGDDGNDIFYFSSGNNDMDGGAGTDTVDYSGSPGSRGVTVNLKTGKGSFDAVGDTYVNIENVVGTDKRDDIWGNALANTFDGKGDLDNFIFASVADLNGDTINQFFPDRQRDRIDLSRLNITLNDIDASNIFGDHTVVYTIHGQGQTGSLTVQLGKLSRVLAQYSSFSISPQTITRRAIKDLSWLPSSTDFSLKPSARSRFPPNILLQTSR